MFSLLGFPVARLDLPGQSRIEINSGFESVLKAYAIPLNCDIIAHISNRATHDEQAVVYSQ
jgi:hypothetical protein